MWQDSPLARLRDAPRAVPVAVRLRLLFGGFLNQFGWFFFGFGMIFVWVFVPLADIDSWLHFRGELQTVRGEVTSSDQTRGSENDRPIHEIHYRFVVDGREMTGLSYTTSSSFRPGQTVTVEHPADNASRSRIQGLRTRPFGIIVLFVVVFPAIGVGLIIPGLALGRKAIRLLRMGHVARGRLKSKKSTGGSVNNDPIFKLTFEFRDESGETHTATAKTHRPQALEDDEEEPLLYDPANPSCAVMLDHLPGKPEIDESGRIRSAHRRGTLLALAIPAASLIGHGLVATFRFFV